VTQANTARRRSVTGLLVDVPGDDLDAAPLSPSAEDHELGFGVLPAPGAVLVRASSATLFAVRLLSVGRRFATAAGVGGFDERAGGLDATAVMVADEEERARLIAARARRLILDEEAAWEGCCLPGCPYCALEAAREQLDEEHGWSGTIESRDLSEAAMRAAVPLLRDTGVHDHAR
jgi:hypothetical protein